MKLRSLFLLLIFIFGFASFSYGNGFRVYGRVLDVNGETPIGSATIYLYEQNGQAHLSATSDKDGRFVIDGLQGRYTINIYAPGYKSHYLFLDIKEDNELNIKLDPTPPQLNISSYARTFSLEDEISINLSCRKIDEITLSVYKIEPDGYIDSSNLSNFPQQECVYSTSTKISYKYEWFNTSFKIPKLSIGLYIIVGKSKGLEDIIWINITEIALLTKASKEGFLIYSCNIRNSKPIPDVSIEIWENGTLTKKGKTDKKGIYYQKKALNNIFVKAKQDKNLAFIYPSYYEHGIEDYKIYLYTDRPIYRPGHKVYLKSIVRKDNLEMLSIPKTLNLHIQIFDPDDSVIHEENFPFSATLIMELTSLKNC